MSQPTIASALARALLGEEPSGTTKSVIEAMESGAFSLASIRNAMAAMNVSGGMVADIGTLGNMPIDAKLPNLAPRTEGFSLPNT